MRHEPRNSRCDPSCSSDSNDGSLGPVLHNVSSRSRSLRTTETGRSQAWRSARALARGAVRGSSDGNHSGTSPRPKRAERLGMAKATRGGNCGSAPSYRRADTAATNWLDLVARRDRAPSGRYHLSTARDSVRRGAEAANLSPSSRSRAAGVLVRLKGRIRRLKTASRKARTLREGGRRLKRPTRRVHPGIVAI